MPRPNIIYLHSHDTGRYIQPYGHAIPTPNMQRLAEEGVLFRQAFCAAPTCSPSRAALLTGQSPHNSGMTGLVNRGWGLADFSQHIVHTLREGASYQSTLIGLQHVAKDPSMIGYDQLIPLPRNDMAHAAPAAIQFLESAPQQPFFLTVGVFEVHREFPEAGPAEDPRYCLPPAPLPDTPETRQDMATFKAGARVLDTGIGTILDALEANGLAENTLVINTTDHGVAFPGLKGNLTDHGMGVLLMMRGPGEFNGGKVIDGMVSHIDVFPTLCDLLEIEPPDWLQGRSMMPLVRGEAHEINDQVFAEVSYHAAYEPKRAVRSKRYKYIRHYGGRGKPVLPNCDDSLSKDVWLQAGWGDQTVASERLYDLIFDPHETNNLAAEPAMQSTLQDMRDRLNHWMQETDDPLLRHEVVPAPPTAELNDPAGQSPQEPTYAPS